MKRLLILLFLALLPSVALAEEFAPYLDDMGTRADNSSCVSDSNKYAWISENIATPDTGSSLASIAPSTGEKIVVAKLCLPVKSTGTDSRGVWDTGFDSDHDTLIVGD